MPDLLFLTQRLPYPPTKGEKIRQWQILRYLAQRYDIHLGCLLDDPADEPYIETVRAICRSMHVVRLSRTRASFNCLQALLTGQALSVACFHDRTLAHWVRDVISNVRPAVVFVASSNMAPYVLDQPRTGMRVVDLVDADSEKWRAYARSTAGPMRLVYRRECRAIAALEQRIGHETDLASFVSDAEAALFAGHTPRCAAAVRVVGNGVDHRYFDPGLSFSPVFDTAFPSFVFTGTMDYPPNIDAVAWFVGSILPRLRQSVPAARCYIVGNHPSRRVRRLARTDGVFVTGGVPDVRPYIAHATASIAPMRIARGIQNKVLEAMSLARPVVLTAAALEGIRADPRREVCLADTSEAFAAACSDLAIHGDTRAVGAAARSLVLRDHDWAVTLKGYDQRLLPSRSRQLERCG